MTFEFKNVPKGSLVCLLFILQWTTSSPTENETLGRDSGNEVLTPTSLGNHCTHGICSDNQFCNELSICQCRPGFRDYNSNCLPCAGKNENCTRHEDCCRMFLCINGICSDPGAGIEFVSLAKICLGITATTIIIAIFSSLIKCMIGYDRFQQFRSGNESDSVNSARTFARQLVSRHTPYKPEEDKPPSYDECVNSSPRNPSTLDPPPPYVISSNVLSSAAQNDQILQTTNWSIVNQQHFVTTPLNTMTLQREVTSEVNSSQAELILKAK